MTWVQFDDGFADHRNNAGLSDAAFRLHVAGILHCGRHLTDGLVDAEEVPRLVRRYRRSALFELLSRGLWIAHGDPAAAYAIHDYLQWNPSRAKVMARREAAARKKRGQRGEGQA